MLRYLGVDAPESFYESATMIFNENLVKRIKEVTVNYVLQDL